MRRGRNPRPSQGSSVQPVHYTPSPRRFVANHDTVQADTPTTAEGLTLLSSFGLSTATAPRSSLLPRAAGFPMGKQWRLRLFETWLEERS